MWKVLHNKSEAKGTKRELFGAKTSPKGSQKGSKASQKATKMHQQIEVRKMSSKRQAPGVPSGALGAIMGPFSLKKT